MNLKIPKTLFLLVVALSLVGMALVFYSTTWGPVITSDSVYYVGSADNLVKGKGFGLPWGSGRFLAYAGDPPFYPLLIAGLELVGFDVVSAARWITILSFGLTLLAVGLLSWRASRSMGLALGLSLLVLTSAMITDLFTRAMSEPVFFLTGFSGALLLLIYLDSDKMRHLLLASVLLSAACLTRYLGAALVLAGGVSLLALSRQLWRTRLAHGVIFAAITSLPTLGWLVYSYTQTGGLGERTLHSSSSVWQATTSFRLAVAGIFWDWLPFSGSLTAHYSVQKVILGLLFLVLLAAGILAVWRGLRNESSQPMLRWVCFFGLFASFFLIFYALAFIYSHPTPDLNERLFAPLYLGIIFMVFGLAFLASQNWLRMRWIAGLPLVFVVLNGAADLPKIAQNAETLHQEGSGYTGRAWRESRVMEALNQLPEDTPIITNEADAVLFLTGRPCVWLPDVIASQPVETFTRFGESPAETREEKMFREGAALVIFPSITRQLTGLYGDQATDRLESLTNGLAAYVFFSPQEAIYFYRPESIPRYSDK